MKKIVIILTLIVLPYDSLLSQIEEERSVKEFQSGQIHKFTTNGTGKAQGLKIHFKYPKSWASVEGDRPHILRKFIQSDNYALGVIFVRKAEQDFLKSEISEIFSTDGLKSAMPLGAKYISSNPNLKFDNLRCGSIEYSIVQERIDKKIYMHCLQYLVVFKNYIVTVTFSVSDTNGSDNPIRPKENVDLRYKSIYPLFWGMFNSLVIDNLFE